ncbi:MAG: DUF3341 domain-containing protein, partial [Chitinophagaceae bacterium]|nr:DUF3341 domain-containing protein [Chitinophagaceae bacterium]
TETTNTDEAESFLSNNGSIEVKTEIAEDGWWFGRYDKEEKLFESNSVVA